MRGKVDFKLGIAVRPVKNFLPVEVHRIVHIYALEKKGETVGTDVIDSKSFFVTTDSLRIEVFAVINHPVMRNIYRLPVIGVEKSLHGST